jgi:ribonuclease HIII
MERARRSLGAMSDFRAYCEDVLRRARDAGFEVVGEKALPYGRQYQVTRGGTVNAVLSCYFGKKGFKFVPGGKAGDDLAAALGGAGPGGAAPGRTSTAAGGPDPFGLGMPRIGADESGKGDYFGPLVVAAWRIEDDHVETLRDLGVTDSKALGDARIERIAGRLDDLGCGAVSALMPREYNPRYASLGNLNHLLSEMHGDCIRGLVERTGPGVRAVLVDQYARHVPQLWKRAALPAGCRLETRPKGEADAAVAAASILARAEFVRGLRELSHEFGHTFPPGAGAPVLQAGRAFVRLFGRARLSEVAKVHFATSAKL